MNRSFTAFLLLFPLVLSGSACSNAGEHYLQLAREKAVIAEENARAAAEGRRGYLGVGIQDMRPALARERGLAAKTGALVTSVEDDSPAAVAGIKDDDVIIEFNKATIDDAADLRAAVRKTEPGTKVPVTVMRKDGRKTLQVEVGSLPETRVLAATPRIPIPPVNVRVFGHGGVGGLVLMDLNPQLAEYFGTPAGKGVLVEQVLKRSAAKEAGFKAGDIILRVGETEIGEADDVHEAIAGRETGDTVAVGVLRRGMPMTLRMEVDEDPAGSIFYRYRHGGTPRGDKEIQFFQQNRMQMQEDLKRLQEELRSVGREIRGRVEELRNTVRRELRQVVG